MSTQIQLYEDDLEGLKEGYTSKRAVEKDFLKRWIDFDFQEHVVSEEDVQYKKHVFQKRLSLQVEKWQECPHSDSFEDECPYFREVVWLTACIKPRTAYEYLGSAYINGIVVMSMAFSCTWNPKLNTMKLVAAR